MRMSWKQITTTAVSTATAAVVIIQAYEMIATRFERITNAVEQREMGPNPEEMWRYSVDAKLDTLKAYHERGNDEQE
ncbi:MAG: hypothetical protein V3W44_07330 [Dehalococcoidales bacterium]